MMNEGLEWPNIPSGLNSSQNLIYKDLIKNQDKNVVDSIIKYANDFPQHCISDWNGPGSSYGYKKHKTLPFALALKDRDKLDKVIRDIRNASDAVRFVGAVGLEYSIYSYNDHENNIRKITDPHDLSCFIFEYRVGPKTYTIGLTITFLLRERGYDQMSFIRPAISKLKSNWGSEQSGNILVTEEFISYCRKKVRK